MTQYKIEEHKVAGMPLGRHVYHDERSKMYLAKGSTTLVDKRHKDRGAVLDQGDVGACTGFAEVGALNCMQLPTPPGDNQMALNVYHAETVLEGDPWPPDDPGGTGVYACKAGQQLGLLSGYTHTLDFSTMCAAVVLSPGMLGINWYEGFDSPNPTTGLVKIAGSVRGGHEVACDEIVVSQQLFGFKQSWGNWGLNGRFYIRWSDIERLLHEDGDFTVPIPVNQPAPVPVPVPPTPAPPVPAGNAYVLTDDNAADVERVAAKRTKKRGPVTGTVWLNTHLENYFND